jgi:hypothetical protein
MDFLVYVYIFFIEKKIPSNENADRDGKKKIKYKCYLLTYFRTFYFLFLFIVDFYFKGENK